MSLPDRRPSDTPRSYAALCDYCAMGPARSIDKLLQFYNSSVTASVPTKHRGTLGLWSGKHSWVERANESDRLAREAEDAARATIRAERRKQLEDQDFSDGNALREATRAILSELPRFIRHTETEIKQDGQLVKVITLALKAGPGELARALELASKLQRLSVGEATEQSNQTIEIRYVDSEPDPETPA